MIKTKKITFDYHPESRKFVVMSFVLRHWWEEKDESGDMIFEIQGGSPDPANAPKTQVRCHWFIAAPHSKLFADKKGEEDCSTGYYISNDMKQEN